MIQMAETCPDENCVLKGRKLSFRIFSYLQQSCGRASTFRVSRLTVLVVIALAMGIRIQEANHDSCLGSNAQGSMYRESPCADILMTLGRKMIGLSSV